MAVDESLCILFEDHFKFTRDEEVTRNFINFFQVNLQSYSRNESVLCLASLVHHFRDNSIHLHLFIIRSFLKRIRLKGFFHFLFAFGSSNIIKVGLLIIMMKSLALLLRGPVTGLPFTYFY
jgi:hypothetical protein